MILQQYGITLKRLTLDDIELVRYWRNDPEIQQTMNFREYITQEMQLSWFHSINNPLNYYFIIDFESKKIGLINAKNVSLEDGSVEGGIFVWDKQYHSGLQPVYASLCLMNGAFKNMNFFTKFIVQVRRDNPKALTYNSMLGYQINEEKSTKEYYVLELSKQDFFEHTERLNKIAQKLTNGEDKPIITGFFDAQLHIDEFRNILTVQ